MSCVIQTKVIKTNSHKTIPIKFHVDFITPVPFQKTFPQSRDFYPLAYEIRALNTSAILTVFDYTRGKQLIGGDPYVH